MGSFKRVVNYKLVSAQSLASSFNTPSTDTGWVDNLSYEISITGASTNTGSFTLQASNDNINWSDVNVSQSITLANQSTKVIPINIREWPFKYARLAFIPAGGTPNGVCDIWINFKGI